MFVNPEDQAIALLNNKQLNYEKRELAIHYICEHPTQEGIKALVGALRDPEFGVRWTASTALAQLGSLALPEVLRALANPKTNTVRLREGVIHILHYSSNLAHEPVYKHPQMEPQVKITSGASVSVGDLMTALKGPAADISSMDVAGRLLLRLEK
jgi:hypothetical protein